MAISPHWRSGGQRGTSIQRLIEVAYWKGVEMPSEIAAPRLQASASAESKPSLLTRLRTKLRSRQLDRALAAGASPSESDELSLRAKQLGAANGRLANAIEHLILRSELARALMSPSPPSAGPRSIARTSEPTEDRWIVSPMPSVLRGHDRFAAWRSRRSWSKTRPDPSM